MNHLVDLGHKRIGFIGAPLYYNFAYMRLEGYKQALAENNIDYDESIVITTEMSDDAGEIAAANLLESTESPTALL